MTLYDDAELAALTIVRLAATESEGEPESQAMRQVTTELFKQYGLEGVAELVIELARYNAEETKNRL